MLCIVNAGTQTIWVLTTDVRSVAIVAPWNFRQFNSGGQRMVTL